MTSLANMSPAALAAWERLTQAYGQPLNINSAYRDPAHNAKVGGAKKSQHIHGNAFDVDVSDLDRQQRLALIEQARAAGFKGIGVYDNALHFDVGPSRAWGSDYTSASLPEWAAGAVGSPVGNYSTGAPAHGHETHERWPIGEPVAPPANALAQQQQPQPFQIKNALRVQDFLLPTQQPQFQRFT